MFKNKRENEMMKEKDRSFNTMTGSCVDARYYIRRRIGFGSFGSVYSVRDLKQKSCGTSLVLKASSKNI